LARSANEAAGIVDFDPEAPLIEMHDAVIRRGGKDLLQVDDFVLDRGDNMVLLGPNGAGKSTFIHLITREMHPLHRDVPSVRFCGSDRIVVADVKKMLGIVSASMQDQIAVHLPVLEVVVGGLYGSLGVPRHVQATPQDYERAQDTLDLLGIGSLADRDVKTLSSGQARRVLIARALVHDPQVLILDEPCTGLDPEGMYYVRRSLRKLAQQGKGIIMVTHYPEDILPEIDRVVMIKDGRIYDDGPKAELMTNERISGLFGIPLEVKEQNGYYSLVSEY
jgi:iron complex transport system ATP-binding protein